MDEGRKVEIELKDVSKVYYGKNKETVALSNMNLEIFESEFICCVGPSGCGKTTLLNLIAGLQLPSTGTVKVDNVDVKGPGKERGVVFQQYALFPWLTVRKNVSFGLEINGVPKNECKEISEKYIELVGLKDFCEAYPKELSGGMKQRVAIARAFAMNPKVLLLDEPFGALDAQSRAQLQENLLHTWQAEKKTCFFITHDVEEAVLLASRIIVMSARPGRVKEIINNDIPYPRNQETKLSAAFNNIRNNLWSGVYQEYLSQVK